MKKIISLIVKFIRKFLYVLMDILFMPVLFIAIIFSRHKKKKISIGLGPLPMINNVYWKKSLERKGYSVETYTQDTYFITNQFDFICDKNNHSLYYRVPVLLFIRCILRYECLYIYFNGGPLQVDNYLRWLEPILLKLSKVKIVVMPYGSDCQIFERTPNKVTVNGMCKDYSDFFRYNHANIIKQVDRWTKYSDIVIGTMDSIDYLYYWNRIIPCHFAINTDDITPKNSINNNHTLKILHAPNHTNIKGTYFLEEAIKQLKNEGYNLEYIRIQSKPNNEIIEAIKEADIIVDQLVIGWYAMFAMETMACGKPCICYIRKDLEDLYIKTGCLKKGEIPLINATTDTIYEVLKNLLDNPSCLKEIGEKSREYVVRRHSLDSIGDFYSEINKSIGIGSRG